MAALRRKYSDRESTGSDDYHLKKMNEILHECKLSGPFGETPGQLFDWLYIGSYSDAENYTKIRLLGITHVVNCAAFRKSPNNPYREEAGVVGYLQFDADDSDDYNILQHVIKAKDFIDNARASNGTILVHCAAGINRCGAICVAYIMLDKRWDLLTTVSFVKSKRRMLLANRGFRKQLVQLARRNGLLKKLEA